MTFHSCFRRVAAAFVLLCASQLRAADLWSGPAFSADPAALRLAAQAVAPEEHVSATLLLNDLRFTVDESGKIVKSRHLIYRIETQEAVEGWAEVSGRWKAWYQERPEIKARVITAEGALHWLDPKTLNDRPVHEDSAEVYSDERKYGGPLPAVAVGAIIEEQVVTRDVAPLFAAGSAEEWSLGWSVPVSLTHIVISHPESVPLLFQLLQLPNATIAKSSANGIETLTVEQGPLAAYPDTPDDVPPDVVVHPELQFSTGTSWQRVAAEYVRLSEPKLRVGDVETLVAKAEIRRGSRLEQIRRIVAILHRNVRYTGVEFGESSLIPQFPSETLKRRYGDCKDKAALLVTMLRAAGIAANLALLENGPGSDINPELPGMGVFGHAIVYVPPSAADPELWIDATAEYSEVGTLPWMDYGRWALVASEKTQSLKKIPGLSSAQNVQREVREFTLAEYGPATILETDHEIGPREADYREYYSRDSKEIRKNSESYVKSMYLADSLTSLEHSDLSDLNKPALIKFVAKGKRGSTDLTSAVVAIRTENLFSPLPEYFKTKDTDQSKENDDPDKPKPRTVDWWLTPFTTEWQYKVIAPAGFKLRALPPDKTQQFGALTFSQEYSANPEGSIVEATLRVENTNTRLSVQQAKDLRESVLNARDADAILISFDQIGHSLISSGKIREGLAAYEQLATEHPKEALHKVQLAQALLSAGLGEQARRVVLEGTILEPTSALAFSTLGTILKHDLIGRLLKSGMDYDGAIAAYKKAIALDPKDPETRANLPLLMEYDLHGVRYGEKSRLKDAVTEFKALKKVDEAYARSYDDNILYDLWYAHDYQGVLDFGAALPTNDARKSLRLAALTLLQGTSAALHTSLQVTTEDSARGKALISAGALLVRVRKYAEASVLLTEGSRGQSNENQVMQGATLFGRTKPYEELNFDSADPRRVIQEFFEGTISGEITRDELASIVDFEGGESTEFADQKQFDQMMSKIKAQLGNSGLSLITVADLAISNMHYTVEGDDSLGYKIIVESPGAKAQSLFVLRDEARHYKIAGFSMRETAAPEQFGMLTLQALAKNNLAAARIWLDRARDEVHITGGDDPLSGQPFPHFWTKGQEADLSAIRTAALVLLPSRDLKGTYFSDLNQAREAARTDIERSRLTMVLAYAQSAQKNWAEMLILDKELMIAFPASVRAFEMTVTAYSQLKQFDEWESLVRARIAAYPGERAYVRSSARLATFRGQFEASREIIKTIIDKGQATDEDLNSYAWLALMLPGPIQPGTIEIAQRANALTKNENFSILHTLACIYAQAGQTSQARELLLKAMDSMFMEEPNSAVWFGFG